MACAWTAFFANLIMMVLSYFLGQKNYPIQYDLKSAGFYVVISAFLFAGIMFAHGNIGHTGLRLLVNTVLIGIYLVIVLKKDLPLQQIPFINKYFTK
jgi:hypothetical protein